MLADTIAGLRSSAGTLVSVYVQRPSQGGFAAQLHDLLKPIRLEAEAKHRDVRISVRGDAERIRGLADRMESESTPSYAILASGMDGVFVVDSLTHRVPNTAALGARPYLRPLRAAPRPFRAGVLVGDHALTRVFVSSGDLVEEIGSPLAADIGKSNYGGFSGYEEHNVRARAEETSRRMWREAGSRLMVVHQSRPLDYIAVGAHEESVEEIGHRLHPYLASLYRAAFTASPQAITLASLSAELAGISEGMRRRRQMAIVGHVCDVAWSGGLALLGLRSIIEVANVQAIEALVVAENYVRPGVMCGECGHLARLGDDCPVCGHSMFATGDIVSSVMDAAVASGGRVRQIGVASPLDVEGIGALIRFPLRG